MEIHLGNSWKNLADILISKVSSFSFFEKKYLILPSNFQKNWLFERWASSEKQIVMGIKTFSIQEAVLHFLQKTKEQEIIFPSCIEHKIALQKELYQICEIKNDPRFLDIQKYLAEDREKKILYLTSELYDLFTFYGQYGLNLSLNQRGEKSWQEYIWKNVFSKNGYHIPFQELSKPIFSFKEKGAKIFFFGFSYLPPVYFDFFYRLSKYAEIFQIMYSSTQGFLEDTVSDFEEKKLRKKYINVDWLNEYLDSNRLVGNWAKLEKEFQRTLGNYELNICEHYFEKPVQNCLESLQNDIFTLEENPEKVSFKNDSSILLEKVPGSKMQEVIVLQQNLSVFLKEGISLNEIFVLAPDINEYLPFIHMLFGAETKGLNYKISDVNLLKQSHFARGILNVLELTTSAWNESEITSLFNNPLIQKKFSFTNKEAELFSDWLQKAHTYFGYDASHNLELIGKKDSRNTFKECLQRLISSLVLLGDNSTLDCEFPFPIVNMDLNEADVLNIFIILVQSLRENTVMLSSYTLQEWGIILEKLAETFFFIDHDDYMEKSALETFHNIIHNFKISIEEKTFEFAFIFLLVRSELQKATTSYQPHLCDAIQFSSLTSGNIKPAKVIYLLGMHESSEEVKTSLNLLQSAGEFYPTFSIKKRYQLLQLINFCSEHLVLSFPIKASDEAIENSPSTILQEFISYMERIYPSHFLYREKEVRTEFEQHKQTFTTFDVVKSEGFQESSRVISLTSLKLLLKDPFRFYLKQKHNIQLEYDDLLQQDDIFLSALNKYIITQQSLSSELKQQISIFDKLRLFPVGVFKDIAENALLKEVNSYHLFLKGLNIDPSNLQTIEFKKECKKPYFERNNAIFPAIEVQLYNKIFYLVGRVQQICSRGLILFKEDKINSYLENWAAILALRSVEKHLNTPSCSMIFLKSQSEKTFSNFNVQDAWKRLVQYFLVAEKSLSPMEKKIAAPLIAQDEEKFIKNYYQLVKEKQNWLINHITLHDPKSLFKNWSQYIGAVFQELT